MNIFNFFFFVKIHISARIWATFTLMKALKSISECFVAVSLNLEAILVSLFLITFFFFFLINEAPYHYSSNKVGIFGHAVLFLSLHVSF